MSVIRVPKLCLVVLVGPSGSGKSTFARQHFLPTEVLSSDYCRGLVADDENDQAATQDAFDVLHYIAKKRLAAGRLVVVDATNVQAEARRPLLALAKEHDVLPVAIVLNLPEEVCQARNAQRPDRAFGPHVVRQHRHQLRRALRGLKREGFRQITVLDSEEAVAAATVERVPLWNDRREERGPFDIIGDVHGCFDELTALLGKLGYIVAGGPEDPRAHHPEGRKAVFLGDLVDRGPASPAVLRLAMRMVADGAALAVPGNHDAKLLRKLNGKQVQPRHGLAETLAQLEGEPEELLDRVRRFIDGLVSHLVLDEGRLVVAHAGLKEAYQGRASGRVRSFCLYGDTDGEIDSFGLPVRHDWAAEYRGAATVVYGHTPVPTADWVNRTICIDTGCVFGGRLTALRYPERELVEVPAARVYYEPVRPLEPAPQPHLRSDHDVDITDVTGKRIIITRLRGNVMVRAENGAAALEAMSRFAVDPRWLIYLPPTMSPSETRAEGEELEHPEETFGYFQTHEVEQVICEEKHMGSRAVLVVCRDEDAAHRRFGIQGDGLGVMYTRTGRPFFSDKALEQALLTRVRDALQGAGFFERFATEWFCLDAELMPWSAKAQALLREQYAPVGASAGASLARATEALARAAARTPDAAPLLARFEARRDAVTRYTEAYRRYCWPVEGLQGLRLAPFHLLASEGAVHTDADHVWHMETLAELTRADPELFHPTAYRVVDLGDAAQRAEATAWWSARTAAGSEGMVVKPLAWITRGPRGLVQPALKCRGREYLRIIYGPEYTLPEHLERLRSRGLQAKRGLALREFALGLEALHRFVEREPLYRVHECVFGVLAMESEPVDPRL
ncbi:MAG: polynucleotide kinase-phosphatase [Myxococcales bacterium]|nr:polynucleotide kinase-phosphatase [Myxococcales bacterium]MCB9647483.1 polynucleotide kinase-phosphatase [Deltaproteobacteria bacterium]